MAVEGQRLLPPGAPASSSARRLWRRHRRHSRQSARPPQPPQWLGAPLPSRRHCSRPSWRSERRQARPRPPCGAERPRGARGGSGLMLRRRAAARHARAGPRGVREWPTPRAVHVRITFVSVSGWPLYQVLQVRSECCHGVWALPRGYSCHG